MMIRTNNRRLGAVVLGLAVVGGNIAANASVRLPAEQISGMPSLAPILKQVEAAVVTIAISGDSGPENRGQHPRRSTYARDVPAERQIKPSGSGVLINANKGVIFTNSHVIDHADEIVVTLPDGRELPAKRVGSDRGTDVAVIKVQAQNLTALPIGDSDGLEVGDFVLAIGNPYQIGQTVTAGIISGLHRRNVGIAEYEDFIQTDAAIYPGDSGGALVNLDGKLIGINTACIGTTTTNPGMGFAIPINMVRLIADQLLKYNEVRRGRLGLTFEDPTPGPDSKLGAHRSGDRTRDREGRKRLAQAGRRPEGWGRCLGTASTSR
jgi:S1-C subfamily serine protease